MRTTATLILVITLSVGIAYAHTNVTPAQVKAMIDAGGPLTIVDVREESEYCDSTYSPPGHIPGAINMPWNSGYFEDHYTELPTDEDLVIVCRSGARSNAAATFLDNNGYTRVFDMLGGMNAWTYETEDCEAASVPGRGKDFALALGPASPNPFGSETEIVLVVPSGGHATLRVYDALGRVMAELLDDYTSGVRRVTWDGKDSRGRRVASGVYFYRLTWNGESRTSRMVLAR